MNNEERDAGPGNQENADSGRDDELLELDRLEGKVLKEARKGQSRFQFSFLFPLLVLAALLKDDPLFDILVLGFGFTVLVLYVLTFASLNRDLEKVRARKFLLLHGEPVFRDIYNGLGKILGAARPEDLWKYFLLFLLVACLLPALAFLGLQSLGFWPFRVTYPLLLVVVLGLLALFGISRVLETQEYASSIRVFEDGLHIIERLVEERGRKKVFFSFEEIGSLKMGEKKLECQVFYLGYLEIHVGDTQGFLLALKKGFGERWEEVFKEKEVPGEDG